MVWITWNVVPLSIFCPSVVLVAFPNNKLPVPAAATLPVHAADNVKVISVNIAAIYASAGIKACCVEGTPAPNVTPIPTSRPAVEGTVTVVLLLLVTAVIVNLISCGAI